MSDRETGPPTADTIGIALIARDQGGDVTGCGTLRPPDDGVECFMPFKNQPQAVAPPSHPVSISPGGSSQAAAAAWRIRAAAAAPGSSTPRATSPT